MVKTIYCQLGKHPWTDLTLKYLQKRTGLEILFEDLEQMSYYELKKRVKRHVRCSKYANRVDNFECQYCKIDVIYIPHMQVQSQYRYVLSCCCGAKIHNKSECIEKYLRTRRCGLCGAVLLESGIMEEPLTLHAIMNTYIMRDRNGVSRKQIMPPLREIKPIPNWKLKCNKINSTWQVS